MKGVPAPVGTSFFLSEVRVKSMGEKFGGTNGSDETNYPRFQAEFR
jgi:hypothetical protein